MWFKCIYIACGMFVQSSSISPRATIGFSYHGNFHIMCFGGGMTLDSDLQGGWNLLGTSPYLRNPSPNFAPQSSQVKSLPRLKDSRDVSSCGFQSEVMIVKVCSEDSEWQEAEGSWSPEISNDCRNDSGAGCPTGLTGTDWILLISAQFRLSWGHPWDSDTGVRNEVLITMCTSLSFLHQLRCSRSCLCKSLLSFWTKNY